MGNNTTESKLDETIKNTLNEYEAKFDTGDWSRMESMLNAAPKSSNFNWSKPLTVIVGLVIVGGGYLIFRNVGSSKPSTETTIETPAPAVNTSPEKVSSPPPAVTKTETPVVTTPAVKEQPVVSADSKEKTNTTPLTKTTETITAVNPAVTAADKSITKEKIKKDNSTANDSNVNTKQKVSVMGNTPIFGDMIDSSKGVIHETKEKESIKKAAKSKGSTPIGWGLLNQNIDSLKKHNEQIKKDSIK